MSIARQKEAHMDRTKALNLLKAISQPILQDGGNWQFGHTYFILTAEGMLTVDCTAYYPIHGPIKVSKKRFMEIKKMEKSKEGIEALEDEEQLLLIHEGKPDVDYWAFQPFDDAHFDEYTFSSDRRVIESKFVDTSMDWEIEEWDDMDEETLIEWAESIE